MVRSSVPFRVSWRSLTLFAALYFAAVAVSMTTRYGGGVACMWLASGVLGPMLAVRPVREWPPFVAVAFIVGAPLTATAGLGPTAAIPLGALNMIEGILFALAIRRWAPVRDGALRSMEQVAVLLAGGIAAAALTGLPAAVVASGLSGTSFWHNWSNWATGHALGTIALTPIALLVLSGDLATWWRDAGQTERAEAGVHVALVTSVSLFTFGQSIMPLSFLPLLPVMLATFRLGRVGATLSTLIVSTAAIGFSLNDSGPISLVRADGAMKMHLVQFYLASIVLTVLPAAADLRRRKDVLARLAASEERYRLVTENASDVVMTLDARGEILFVSPSIEAMGDYRVEALRGTLAMDLVLPDDRAMVARAHLEALRVPGTTQMVEYRSADGARWVETRVRAIDSGDGSLSLICAIRDISKRKMAEVELQRAARTDPLTGLANRRLFNEAVDGLIARSIRDPHVRACVAIFDIDHFKRVNDSCGHDGGDRVLRRFAEIASRTTRANDVVARLGGEEFGVVLSGTDMREAEKVCERLRREFAGEPTLMDDGGTAWATVSAGVARIRPMRSRDDVLRDADAALYTAKRSGRDRLVLAN